MRLARKLFLLTAMAVAALAMTTTTASAVVTVLPEAPEGTSCGTVTEISGHAVSGGCHVEFRSTGTGIPLHAYIPAKTTISNCEVYLEGWIGTNGEGYVTEMDLTAPHGGSVPCTREPCDEAAPSHRDLLWPVHIVEHGPGAEEAEAVFCLRPLNPDNEGGVGTRCEIHLPLTDLGEHNYELGTADADNGTEIACENNPPNSTGHPSLPFPVSIEPHLVTTSDPDPEGTQITERVEIIH